MSMQTALALVAVVGALVAAGAWVAPEGRRSRAAAGRLLLALSALVWAVVAATEGQLHLIGSSAALAAALVGALLLPRPTPRSSLMVLGLLALAGAQAGWLYTEAPDAVAAASLGWLLLAAAGWQPGARESSASPGRLYHDPLTGLANEELLTRRVALALAACRESGKALTLVRLELRGVDAAAGGPLSEVALDELRVAVARRLSGAVRSVDTVARLEGERFAVLAEGLDDPDQAGLLAARARLALRDPFVIDGRVLALRADTELAVGFGDGESAAELVAGANGLVAASERDALEAELRRALARGELELAYQPVFDLRGGGVEAVEALLRWRHPERGMLTAAEFLPAAESSDLILEIGDWVLGEACAQWRRWLDSGAGWARLGICVNLSGRQLRDPRLAGALRDALLTSGVPAGRLVLEIAEHPLGQDAAAARARIAQLRELGVTVSLDDFGTGFSSIGALRDAGVDTLKLDSALVGGIRPGSREAGLAAGIVSVARALGISTVAEGIERPEQLTELRAMGCELGQGELLARPRDADALELLLAGWQRSAA